jgi:small-conductance mechanosensitive channel
MYSVKRLFFYLIIVFVTTVCTLYLFHQFVAQTTDLSTLIDQSVEIVISVSFLIVEILIVRHFKPFMIHRIGEEAAVILQYIIIAIALTVTTFSILSILNVSTTTLFASAGIISITAGLVVSTFVGNLLSGFYVFTTHRFRVGDDVLFNNIPGKVKELTVLAMKVQTDMGLVTIPNSAIASGTIIITDTEESQQVEGRIFYAVGDRVFTSFNGEQGVVKKITPYHTVILLDSGKEIAFLNTSILSGTFLVAKITEKKL